MIYAISGDVGSGKSAYLVERVILPALAKGREVWTNVRVRDALADNPGLRRFKDFFAVVPEVTSAGDLICAKGQIPAGALVVIDEAGIALMSGADKHKRYRDVRAYLAQHRHFVDSSSRSTDIWLACQDLSQVTQQARTLVSYTFYLRSLKTLFGFSRGTEYRLFTGPLTRDEINPRGSRRGAVAAIGRGTFYPKKSTFALYDSHDIPPDITSGLGVEDSPVQSVLSFRLFLLLVLFVIIFALGYTAWSRLSLFLSPQQPQTDEPLYPVHVVPAPAAPPAPPAPLAGFYCYVDGCYTCVNNDGSLSCHLE